MHASGKEEAAVGHTGEQGQVRHELQHDERESEAPRLDMALNARSDS